MKSPSLIISVFRNSSTLRQIYWKFFPVLGFLVSLLHSSTRNPLRCHYLLLSQRCQWCHCSCHCPHNWYFVISHSTQTVFWWSIITNILVHRVHVYTFLFIEHSTKGKPEDFQHLCSFSSNLSTFRFMIHLWMLLMLLHVTYSNYF